MAAQPSYRPLEESTFFPDRRASRPLEPGTVARGQVGEDNARWAGRRSGAPPAGEVPWFLVPVAAEVGAENYTPQSFVERVPVEVTREVLERGRQRFNIFCAVCHDRLGMGDGKIVQRGFTRPPSLLDDLSRGFKLRGQEVRLRDQLPDGYIYEVVSNGFGAMPDYSSQIPPGDRWAIVAYVRVLQKGQRPGDRKAANEAPEKKP
jgi:mono/diheme cytochrome c family protein